MKSRDDVWNDGANDIGKERDDEKSQQNDKNDVRTFFHFFRFSFSKFNRFYRVIYDPFLSLLGENFLESNPTCQ